MTKSSKSARLIAPKRNMSFVVYSLVIHMGHTRIYLQCEALSFLEITTKDSRLQGIFCIIREVKSFVITFRSNNHSNWTKNYILCQLGIVWHIRKNDRINHIAISSSVQCNTQTILLLF